MIKPEDIYNFLSAKMPESILWLSAEYANKYELFLEFLPKKIYVTNDNNSVTVTESESEFECNINITEEYNDGAELDLIEGVVTKHDVDGFWFMPNSLHFVSAGELYVRYDKLKFA